MRLFPAMIVVLAAATSLPAGATLREVSAHLAATRTMTADFRQTAENGGVATGTLTLARPGKVRFQYQKDVPLLVVADGKSLAMIDYEVAQVSRYPIRQTPLGVLLDAEADLSKYVRVVSSTPQALTVEAKDRKHPEYGTITIFFTRSSSAPAGLALTGWRVLDAQGNRTDIALSNVAFNVPVADNAFRFKDPRRRVRPGAH
jgi:outer membrane lipoprotein-sorting protein